MSRRTDLEDSAQRHGLTMRTYSPGDGVTRYRFFESRRLSTLREGERLDYFGPISAIYTALGISEAEAFVAGFAWGKVEAYA